MFEFRDWLLDRDAGNYLIVSLAWAGLMRYQAGMKGGCDWQFVNKVGEDGVEQEKWGK